MISRSRQARRFHTCGCCGASVQPGELYVEHTEFPGDEPGYADTAGHPVRLIECRRCVKRYGRLAAP